MALLKSWYLATPSEAENNVIALVKDDTLFFITIETQFGIELPLASVETVDAITRGELRILLSGQNTWKHDVALTEIQIELEAVIL